MVSPPRVLVSACLLGQRVRYDDRLLPAYPLLQQWWEQGLACTLCPEVAGGLPVPRAPAEILDGDGAAVWRGELPLWDNQGRDVAAAFRAGAEQALRLVTQHGIRLAVLKARSPSCGHRQTYDGRFNGTLVSGEGVTAAALRMAGVQVFCEDELDQVAAVLARHA